MKIYYAHPMIMYGTIKELEDLRLIQRKYPKDEIINPHFIDSSYLKDKMSKYLRIVKKCDMVIIRGIPNKPLTGGIGKEINHALKNGIKVFEIKDNKFVQIRNKVKYLSRDETNTMFYEMRSDKKYSKYYTKITIIRQVQITNCIDTNFSKD